MPLIGCRFAETRAAARQAISGTLDVALCRECGHIYNRAFEPDRIDYAPGYENALGFSPRHRAELNATVERLTRSYALHRKSIVEFGCGAAEFLSLLCASGGNHGVGYDPTQEDRVTRAGDGSVKIVAEKFGPTHEPAADLVCSQHVLEHLAELNGTLRQARAILKPDGIGYFQVPNGLMIFRDLNIWDLTYEHVSYFSPASLRRALSETGFSVLRLQSSFGGQYLDADAVAGEAAEPDSTAEDAFADFSVGFPAAFTEILGDWKDRLSGLVDSGRRVVVWGAGTKAVSFLNMLAIGVDNGIEYVVDINPRKAGRFMPGTAQTIVPPDHLSDYVPDTVIVMNREYAGEIRSRLETMGLHCDLIVVSPEIT